MSSKSKIKAAGKPKELTHVSASSITLFSDCETRWYHRYLRGFKTKQTDAMARGSKVHEHLEKYLETGTKPDTETVTGKIAASGLEHLPEVNETTNVEISLADFEVPNLPIAFKGYIDLLDTKDEIHILDHKTTSAWKWTKSEEELRSNMQLIIYARHVLEHHPEAQEVRLTHVYYLTRPPHTSKRVSVVVPRQHVYDEFDKILVTVNKMLDVAENSIDHAEKNKSFCYSYGKQCPHYNDCWYTFERTELLPMSNKQEGVLAFLRGETSTQETQETQAPKEIKEINMQDSTAAITIYVNCRPMNKEVTPIQKALTDITNEICTANGVEHISFIKYAAGWDMLSAEIIKQGLPSGAYYISSDTQLYNRVMDSLMQVADEVVIAG